MKVGSNKEPEPSNTSQHSNLSGNEESEDPFLLLFDTQELEEDRLPSSEEEDEDEEFDWTNEMDSKAVYPEIEANVATEEIGVDQTPMLNQAQQAKVEQSQAFDLSLEVEEFSGMAGKPIQTGGPTASGIYGGKVGQGD